MLQKLIIRQQALKMNDTEFARLLNCSRPLWSLIRRGKQPIGHKVLRGVMQNPQLADLTIDAMKYLQEGNHEEAKDENRNQT